MRWPTRGMRVAGFVVLLVIAGCTGMEVTDLSNDLARLQERKRLIGAARDGAALTQLVQVESEFGRLSESAYAAVPRAPDAKSKILFYRIAATAAWQSVSENAMAIAREGSAFCNANDGMDVSPRDCAVLTIIPSLAVNDIWMKQSRAIGSDIRASGSAKRYREGLDHLIAAYADIGAATARLEATPVAAELITVLNEQRRQLGRNIRDLADLLLEDPTPEDAAEMRLVCADLRRTAPEIRSGRCAFVLQQRRG